MCELLELRVRTRFFGSSDTDMDQVMSSDTHMSEYLGRGFGLGHDVGHDFGHGKVNYAE